METGQLFDTSAKKKSMKLVGVISCIIRVGGGGGGGEEENIKGHKDKCQRKSEVSEARVGILCKLCLTFFSN